MSKRPDSNVVSCKLRCRSVGLCHITMNLHLWAFWWLFSYSSEKFYVLW